MHVQFEFTKEDLVNASKRFFRRRKTGKSAIWKSALFSAFATALMVFLVLQRSPLMGLVFGFITAGIILSLYPRWHQHNLENRLREAANEIMKSSGPYICEVELRAEGLWLRQMEKQTLYEWKSVKEVEETPDSVDIYTHDGSGVVVRNRAFSPSADRDRFIELVRSNLTASRS